MTGFLHLFDRQDLSWLKEMLSKAWSKGLKQLLGLSINADGSQAMQLMNGRPLSVVQSIDKIISTDIVTDPAAGGRLLQLVESINESERRDIGMFKTLIEMFKKERPDLLEGIDIENIKEENVATIFGALLKEILDHKKTAQEAKESATTLAKEKKDAIDNAKENDLEEAIKVATAAVEALGVQETALDSVVKNENSLKQIMSLFEAKKYPLAIALASNFLKAAIKPLKKKKEEPDKDKKTDKELEARINELEKENKITACKAILEAILSGSKLPSAVQEKVKTQFAGIVFKEADLKEAVKLEKATLAKLTESGDIIDLGDVGEAEITLRRTGNQRLQADIDLTLGYEAEESEKSDYEGAKSFTSLREMYVAITGDVEISGQVHQSRLKEAASGSFSYMLGYSINRKMLKEYKALPELWKNIANVVPIKDFKMQELIRWGGFGVLPEVIAARTTQGTATDTATPTYPELGMPVDTEQTYALATKGGLVTITRRAIINDDLRQLTKIPVKLARAANRTLNQFVFDLMLNYTSSGINQGTKWPGEYGVAAQTALYASIHNNYATTALAFDALDDLLRQFYNQGEDGYQTATTDTTLNSSVTTVNVTAGTGQYFKAGDMLRIGGEYMLVTDIPSTNALTVVRGILGTTAASHDKSGETYPVVYKVTSILGLADTTLWVPRSLKGTAEKIINSTLHPENAENGVNTLKGACKVMVSPYLRGDENNYFLSAGKTEIDLIELGFLNGKVAPEILIQDQPTVGNVFVYDTIRYKVRHEYGGSVPDFRAFAAGIVSGIA